MRFLIPSIAWWFAGVLLVLSIVKWRVHTRNAAATTVR